MATSQPRLTHPAIEQRVCPLSGEVYTVSPEDRPAPPTSDQAKLDRDLVGVSNRVTEDFFCDRQLRASTWAPIAILPNPTLYSTVIEMCSGSRTERITHEEHEYLLRTARKIHKPVSDALDYVRWQQLLQTRHSAQVTASATVHLPSSIDPIDVDPTVVTQSSTAVVAGHSRVTTEADEDSHEASSQLPGSWNMQRPKITTLPFWNYSIQQLDNSANHTTTCEFGLEPSGWH